jgi:hypothetical protein
MKREIEATSWLWLATMALAGVGSTFLGTLLPSLSADWHLQDRQAGVLLSSLFAGTFTGTILLGADLVRALRRGSIAALALGLFAYTMRMSDGFLFGACALGVFGFGLGQIMSSINLLVGAARVAVRASALAKLGAAWCGGAVLSPAVTTTMLREISPAMRLGVLALCYLLPIVALTGRCIPEREAAGAGNSSGILSSAAFFWVGLFLIYGGVEDSLAGWMPTLAMRYHAGGTSRSFGSAEWILSVFWLGLIAGRLIMAKISRVLTEASLFQVSVLGSSACVVWLIVASTWSELLWGIGALGLCLGPIFPLLLVSALRHRLSSRSMGLVLAACGIGGILFPMALGLISSAVSLKVAMLVPMTGLLSLFLAHRMDPVLR